MALTEKEAKYHEVLEKALKDYIPAHEIAHAANEICKNPAEETVTAMFHYLDQPDKRFVVQQLFETKAIVTNQIRYAMSDVLKAINA